MLGSTTGNTLRDISLAIDKRVKETGFDYSKYKKDNITVCNLCGSHANSWNLYSYRDRYGLPIRSMHCNSCGLIFITPRMCESAYDEFYKIWYRKLIAAFSNQPEEEQADGRQHSMGADIARKFLAENMPESLKIQRMLDIGGSIGTFADVVCKTLGCKGTVVDPNANELKIAADKGLSVCCSQFKGYVTGTRYDLISMLRTVEHLSDIEYALMKVSQLLTKNGIFLIDIVNHKWLMKMFKDKNVCTKIDHVYQLTDDTIRQYLHKCFPNYEVVCGDTSARYILYLVKPK